MTRASPAGPRAAVLLLATVACLASLAVFFRGTIVSGFDLVTGNVGDNRLIIAILEHWRAAFHGEVPWRSPIFFWPEPGVLGYSEAAFLYLPPYALGRALGLDRYLAFQALLVFTKAVGFVSMALLLRRALAVDRWLALLGAALFTVSNAYYLAAGHSQFFAVSYVPLACWLAWTYWRTRRDGETAAARAALAATVVLLALLLFTGFYVGWFSIFIAAVAFLVAATLRVRRPPAGPALRHDVMRALPDVALAVAVFAVALAPFCLTYLPALRATGGREFTEVGAYVMPPWHVVDVGFDNVVWGSLLRRMVVTRTAALPFAVGEAQRGWPPVLLGIFAATLIATALRARRSRPDGATTRRDRLILVLGTTAVLAWALSVRWGHVVPWKVVFAAVPGASAIRVPVRINFVVNVPVIAVAMSGLERLRARGGFTTSLALAVTAVVLIAEQINATPIAQISRAAERATFDRIGPPPPACRQFYALRPPTDNILETAQAQIDAMLVAYEYRIPTLNGWSGSVPPGWTLNMFDPDSRVRAQRWAERKHVMKGLCALDLTTGTWSPG